ncbi:MAG: hypothetical protein JSU70_00055 [Phycisphaerales bacterium]|nr:MAG: hypothetical protein JSU70_00055 [Phycisphaerales bacterium]
MRNAIPISIVWLTASAAFGAYRLVPSQYLTIQAAIDDCNDRDTVVVSPGVYGGDGNRDIEIIDKLITVRSIDPNDPNVVASTIIDCNSGPGELHRAFYSQKRVWWKTTAIHGLTVANGNADYGGAIYSLNSKLEVINCTFKSNSAGAGGAIYCEENRPVVAEGCSFDRNSASEYGGGMCCVDTRATISSCTFAGNSTSGGGDGGGLYCIDTWAMISNCTFTNSWAGSGGAVCCGGRGELTITNCVFRGNSTNTSGGGI